MAKTIPGIPMGKDVTKSRMTRLFILVRTKIKTTMTQRIIPAVAPKVPRMKLFQIAFIAVGYFVRINVKLSNVRE